MTALATSTVVATPHFSVEGNVFATSSVKHIYANGMLIASIRGSGASSTPYYQLTDHLGSLDKSVTASGTLREVSDYYPFGSVRQNTQYNGFNERKGYIGVDFDDSTGLTQAGARYYAGAIGRFTSQDPVFWQLPKDLLRDPQQLNSYSYGRNNPLAYKDADGKRVELVGRYIPGTANIGVHTFLLITPDASNNNSLGHLGMQGESKLTIGAYNNGGWRSILFGNLYKRTNHKSDYDVDPSKYAGRITIAKPSQYETQEEYEQAILRGHIGADSDLGAYTALAGGPGGQVNSNNYPSDLLLNAGVSRSQINALSGTFSGNLIKPWAPGLGVGISGYQHTNSAVNYGQSFVSSMGSTLNALSSVLSQLSSFLSSLRNN